MGTEDLAIWLEIRVRAGPSGDLVVLLRSSSGR
jgi:hypothetical protein